MLYCYIVNKQVNHALLVTSQYNWPEPIFHTFDIFSTTDSIDKDIKQQS
jgi:hypothetical protein